MNLSRSVRLIIGSRSVILPASISTAADTLKSILENQAETIRGVFRRPSTTTTNSSSADEKKNSRSSNEDLLVVLVGWSMAKQKHVAKYAEVYGNLGLPTLTLTPSLLHTLTISSYEKYSKKVTQVLESTYKGSILFHFFSSSSAIILPAFTRMATKLENIQLKGVVFDCGPILYVRESGMAAAKMLLEQGAMNRLTYYSSIAYGVLMEKLDKANIRQEMAQALKGPILSIPQLYLYSDEDTVVPLKKIEKIIEEQAGMGRTVNKALFKGAPHVKLLQSDPVKYINHVRTFLQRHHLY